MIARTYSLVNSWQSTESAGKTGVEGFKSLEKVLIGICKKVYTVLISFGMQHRTDARRYEKEWMQTKAD
jgi:hypothetical protein